MGGRVLRTDVEDHVGRREAAGAHADRELALASRRGHAASLPYAGDAGG
jgi:hypothetical protein